MGRAGLHESGGFGGIFGRVWVVFREMRGVCQEWVRLMGFPGGAMGEDEDAGDDEAKENE